MCRGWSVELIGYRRYIPRSSGYARNAVHVNHTIRFLRYSDLRFVLNGAVRCGPRSCIRVFRRSLEMSISICQDSRTQSLGVYLEGDSHVGRLEAVEQREDALGLAEIIVYWRW